MTNSILEQNMGSDWAAYHSDCVEFAKTLPDNSIDFCVYSPPFSSLYVYSESIADMGNVESDAQFIEQYRFLIREKLRALRPGRLTAIHVKDLVYYQGSSERGTSGLRPFSDMCTQAHIDEGFDFVCRITIFRDPVLERSKTNAHGLLWKTFKSDATFCRTGMPEYLMVYRKWAKEGQEELVRPVIHPADDVPLKVWQDLASPVWNALGSRQSGYGDMDMPATDVLNVKQARDEKAEKHLCPMPMNITKRAIEMYTNAGDVVWSPFMGIGSEGVSALQMGRRFIGTELHPIYYNQAVKYLQAAEDNGIQGSIFDLLDT
jgi:DNA modification methylase